MITKMEPTKDGKAIKVTAKSDISGKENTMDMSMTLLQFKEWQNGASIQDVFLDLTDDEREFLLTGITADEWDELLNGEISL